MDDRDPCGPNSSAVFGSIVSWRAPFTGISLEYWISNCRADGKDTLYPGIVEIDDDTCENFI